MYSTEHRSIHIKKYFLYLIKKILKRKYKLTEVSVVPMPG